MNIECPTAHLLYLQYLAWRMRHKRWRRRLGAVVLPVAVRWLIWLLWKTCRIQQITGTEHINALLDNGEPFIPCYWHQRQIFCLRYLLDQRSRGLKLGYLISPSADGDVATKTFADQGLHIIRGSATRGGAQALREIYQVIKRDRVSPIITPDGPTGPIYEFKQGVAMLSQLAGAPMLPLAYSSNRYWKLRSWDQFIVPKPFARIYIGIGPPMSLDRRLPVDKLPAVCTQMTARLNAVVEQVETAAHSQ